MGREFCSNPGVGVFGNVRYLNTRRFC